MSRILKEFTYTYTDHKKESFLTNVLWCIGIISVIGLWIIQIIVLVGGHTFPAL
jgi:hypothetical protein